MTAAILLTRLRAAGLRVAADGDALNVGPRELLTDDLRAAIREHKPDLLRLLERPDPGAERRRAKALALLAEHPTWRRVVLAETGDPVIIGIAIRDIGYGELGIPAPSYDATALIVLLDRYGDETPPTVH